MRDFAKYRPDYVFEDVNQRSTRYGYGYLLSMIEVEAFEGGSFTYNGGTFDEARLIYTVRGEAIPITITPDPGYYLAKVEIVGGTWNDGSPIFTGKTCTLRLDFQPLPTGEDTTAEASSSLVINEVGHSSLEKVNGYDWLELYNPTSEEISLKNWQLENGSQIYTFPQITVPAGGFKVIFLSGTQTGGVYAPFTASGGDTLRLLNPTGTEIDTVTLLTRSSSAHLGRYPDGGEWVELTSLEITPNAANLHLFEPEHAIDNRMKNTISINSITLDPSLFTLTEDGSLTVTKKALQNAQIRSEIRHGFLDLFRMYEADETIDLRTWCAEQQDKKSFSVYYVPTLNSYAVYLIGADLDDYEMPL